MEDTDFTGNYETTEGELGGYNGGSAVVVRSTGTAEEEEVRYRGTLFRILFRTCQNRMAFEKGSVKIITIKL